MNRNILRHTILSVIMLLCAVSTMAQSSNTIQLIPDAKRSITGGQTSFSTAAPLLYGMPFELSMNVSLTGATADSAPSFNEWGSAILTTGTNPFDTPSNGIQIYLRCKGNASGTQLVITANHQTFYFNNVQYNTDNFHINLIQSNGQLTIEVTNNASTYGKSDPVNQTIRQTKTMMFNQIDNLCYAMPSGMNVSNLSLTVRTEDICNYINNIMPLGVGYLTQEARDYFTGIFEGGGDAAAKLAAYKDFIGASINGTNVDGKRSYQLPDPGKVYMLGNYIKNGNVRNYFTLNENKINHTSSLVIKDAFNPNDWLEDDGHGGKQHKIVDGDDLYMQNLFSYLWIPRVSKTNDDEMTLYHGTGLGYSLDYSKGLSNSNPTQWTVSHGLELGYVAMRNDAASRFVAANNTKTAFGAWGTGGMYASGKAQGTTWSTDFFLEEVKGFLPYELEIIGINSGDKYGEDAGTHSTGDAINVNTFITQYQVQQDNYVDITNNGVILVAEDAVNSIKSNIKAIKVNDNLGNEKVSVITVGNGIITVEYTDFNSLKGAAVAKLDAAQNRLTNFAAGALYSQTAIDAARTAITTATTTAATNPQQACADLESAMETFYNTIDGRFVTMTNNTSNLISTSNHTNLSVRTKVAAATSDYYGVYQLHHIGNGAYQLRNAYRDNYIGQTTSTATVNSATNAVASRWRGTFAFNLKYTDSRADAYNIVCTNGAANTLLGVGTSNTIAKNSTSSNTNAANLWDVRLVDVKTYANAYHGSLSPESLNGDIGHSPSKSVLQSLITAIGNCPDRASNPTVLQENALALAVNHYIDHKTDINKPANGQYVTFQNHANTGIYIGENLYEMKATTTLDLGCVWETVIDGDKYYFKNLKSGMYMGKVTQSAIGRLTTKNDGANKQEIDIIAAPDRPDASGYVALHEMGTNNYRSYIHYSTDRNAIVGWSAESAETASHWTINEVTDANLITYLKNATANVKSTLSADLTAYNNLGDTPGNYEKSGDDKSAAQTAANATWTASNKAEALAAYNAAVTAFNTFTTAGTAMENNEMFLIKTSIEINDQSGSDPKKYFVTQVLDDNNGSSNGGSLTNGIQLSDTDDFYLFTLWQAVKDGDYYKLYNFYTGHYLSKDVSLSNDAQGRYGLTTNPEDAASFTITPQHGCFVSFHRSDFDEMNSGYLNMITTRSGSRTMFGLSSDNIVTGVAGRMLFELEPSTTKHYEMCLASMLNYELGEGVGKYKDVSGNYETERDKVKALLEASTKPGDYDSKLKNAAKEFAPILAGLRINLPETGKYYRIYSKISSEGTTRYYLSNANPDANAAMIQNAGGSNIKGNTASVFYWDGTHLLSYGNGYYLGNGTPWTMGNIGQKNEFDFANTGYKNKGCYSIKPRGRSYLYNNTTQLNGWSSAFNERCEWYLEEVTELPLVVTSAGFSTLVSGRNHKIPSGVECYTASAVNKEQDQDGTIKLSMITDGILPANVPVLVRGTVSTHYFSEPTWAYEVKDYSDNLFSGELETKASGYTAGNYKQYTLQRINSVTGFYKYNGLTLAGFKAYLDIANVERQVGAKFSSLTFVFSDDELTGIREMSEGVSKAPEAIYDLSGRKVQNPRHGLYIVNGKKYLVR